MSPEPFLAEIRGESTYDRYVEVWFCPPPGEGVSYRVTHDAWFADHRVRAIYAYSVGSQRTVTEQLVIDVHSNALDPSKVADAIKDAINKRRPDDDGTAGVRVPV